MQLSTTLSRVVIGAALAAGAQAALAQQQLVPAQSEVQFTARQMGVPLEGQFKKFSAQVAFDPAKLAAREAEYKARFANPFVAGARGFIDDVILPHETRKRICRSLVMLREKKLENPWRKHGNIPL